MRLVIDFLLYAALAAMLLWGEDKKVPPAAPEEPTVKNLQMELLHARQVVARMQKQIEGLQKQVEAKDAELSENRVLQEILALVKPEAMKKCKDGQFTLDMGVVKCKEPAGK